MGIPLIGERQASRAIGIADARGIRRQGRALGGRAGDGRQSAGRVIDRGNGDECRGRRGTKVGTVGDAEGEGNITVDIGHRGIDQSWDIRNVNHLHRVHLRAVQRQAAASGQAIDAHRFQTIAAVGIGKIKLGGRKSMAVILVQRGRQPAGGGRGVTARTAGDGHPGAGGGRVEDESWRQGGTVGHRQGQREGLVALGLVVIRRYGHCDARGQAAAAGKVQHVAGRREIILLGGVVVLNGGAIG